MTASFDSECTTVTVRSIDRSRLGSAFMGMSRVDLERFEVARGRLGAVAYRLLGSASEAEDVVQESFVRWQAADRGRIEVPVAWLTKVVTNLCLNQLTSARSRREEYVGQWLPEPLLDGDPMLGPAETLEQRESVSLAMLMILETLSPTERAVYVLREAFAVPHGEIAEILETTPAATQQALSRAKSRIASLSHRHRTEADPVAARAIVEEFLAAATSGRVENLVRLLTDDAFGIGDGGGAVPARPKPVLGAESVAKMLRGLAVPSAVKRELAGGSLDCHFALVNTSPALVAVVAGRVVGVIVLDIADGRISVVRSQANPHKLDRATRRWAASPHGRPLLSGW